MGRQRESTRVALHRVRVVTRCDGRGALGLRELGVGGEHEDGGDGVEDANAAAAAVDDMSTSNSCELDRVVAGGGPFTIGNGENMS